MTNTVIGNKLRHFFRVKSHTKTKVKLAKRGNAVLRLSMPIYLTSAGLVLDAYQQASSHMAKPIFTKKSVWLKTARINVLALFNDESKSLIKMKENVAI